MLLERRARDLAAAAEVPLAALDRGLALWGDPGADVELGRRSSRRACAPRLALR